MYREKNRATGPERNAHAPREQSSAHRARDGKAMLQIHTNCFKSFDRPYDYHEINMPSANKAERLISTCLIKAGPSGYLDPGALLCILV